MCSLRVLSESKPNGKQFGELYIRVKYSSYTIELHSRVIADTTDNGRTLANCFYSHFLAGHHLAREQVKLHAYLNLKLANPPELSTGRPHNFSTSGLAKLPL